MNTPGRSVIIDMATRYGMEPSPFEATLRATVVPKGTSREEFAAFLLVARTYNLNPVTREIYAFPKRGGGIQPIVSVDGWANIINSHPQFDGMSFEDRVDDKGNVSAITCRIYRKDRSHPVEATEYMAECKRGTEPWTQWPRRMLRHKAMVQCARYAFALAGIVDPDEYLRRVPTEAVEAPPEIAGGPYEITEEGVMLSSEEPPAPPTDDEKAWKAALRSLRDQLKGASDPAMVEEVWTDWDARYENIPEEVTAAAKGLVDERLYQLAKDAA